MVQLEAARRGFLEFVYLSSFTRAASGVLDEEDLRWVEWILLHEPRAGPVIEGTGGARKLRVSSHGRGKSGGSRLVYLYVEVRSTIYLLLVYAKNQRSDLSPAQARAIQTLVQQLKGEA